MARLPPSGEHPGTGEPGVVRDAPTGEEAVVNLGQDTRNLVLILSRVPGARLLVPMR
jgi:hypothetical protein